MTNSRKATLGPLLFALGMTAMLPMGCAGTGAPGLPPSGAARAASAAKRAPADDFTFTTINNNTDPTFNQLLGINDKMKISGYYGSGATGHPNRGYTVAPPYAQAISWRRDYPGSAQSQVTCIDNRGNPEASGLRRRA